MVVRHVIIVVALQLALHQWLFSLWKQMEQQDRYLSTVMNEQMVLCRGNFHVVIQQRCSNNE